MPVQGSGAVGVVLAAGESKRFGGGTPKQLLPFDDEPMVRRVCRRALDSRLVEVVVVTGHAREEVEAALENLPVRIAHNPSYSEGQASSVTTGLATIDPDASAAIFLPADQPFLTTEVIDRLVGSWQQGNAAIVVPTFEGRRGAPVLFDRSLFAELAGISGDEGGRQLFPRHQARIVEVELDSGEPLTDIDSRETYERLLARTSHSLRS